MGIRCFLSGWVSKFTNWVGPETPELSLDQQVAALQAYARSLPPLGCMYGFRRLEDEFRGNPFCY